MKHGRMTLDEHLIGLTVLIILLLQSLTSCGQNKVIPNFLDISELSFQPEIDPNMPIQGFSRTSYNELVNRMYTTDQKIRDSVMKYQDLWANKKVKNLDSKTLSYLKLMKVNDLANQKLLLRLLAKYGWPRDTVQFGSTKKAWFIAWHASQDNKKQFYIFLEKAVTEHLFETSILKQFRKKMAKSGSF